MKTSAFDILASLDLGARPGDALIRQKPRAAYADATTSRTSTPSSVTSSGALAAIALIRSPAARAFCSESKMIIESPFSSPPPVGHVQ